MKLIDSQHTSLLAKAMDAYSLRQKMTAANIANLDTPDYKRVSVSFEEALREADSNGIGTEELGTVNPKIEQSDEKPMLEEEMLEMADTQIRVQLVTRSLRHSFELMRTGITGRTR